MKRLIPVALFAAFLLTGCGNAGLVHDKAYLRAAAVDGSTVTFSFFSDIPPVTVTAGSPGEGKAAAELIEGKEIFTGFTELIILGDCSPCGTLTAMLNEWKVSPSCLTVSGEGSLLLDNPPELLEGCVRQAQAQGKAPECDIVTILSGLLSEKKTAHTPQLTAGGVNGVCIISSDALPPRTHRQDDSRDSYS